jgi:hypothetical protein
MKQEKTLKPTTNHNQQRKLINQQQAVFQPQPAHHQPQIFFSYSIYQPTHHMSKPYQGRKDTGYHKHSQI